MAKEIQIVFPSGAHESKFKHILGEMSDCSVETSDGRIVSFLRPKNLFQFEQRLHGSGMKFCKVANDLVKFLAVNPTERLMIVVER